MQHGDWREESEGFARQSATHVVLGICMYRKSRLFIVLTLVLISFAGWLDTSVDSHPVFAAIPGQLVTPTPEAPENKAEEVIQAVAERLAQAQLHTPVLALAQSSIESVQFSADENWASALLVPTDPQSGETLPSEPGLALLRRDGTRWQVTLPGDDGWLAVLRRAPDSLLSTAHKDAWIEVYVSSLEIAPSAALSGYLLPWAGGVTRYLSQSVYHDRYTPSGSAHYAFDFYTSGQMWDIYAAKSGTVWLVKDDVPTCLQPTCSEDQPLGNYIVLQDTTTNPVTYQLYLHLAQGSIPPELKTRGAPVLQGQKIGVADNTGQSWGHHLHFQVHTNPLSYWGYAVDISFDDVAINGGRPRTPEEAAAFPDEGWVGQRAYTSQNFIQGDLVPPVGGFLEPAGHDFEITTGRLNISAWASDAQSGLASARVRAFFNNSWQDIGAAFNQPLYEFEWDLCAAGVPPGPVTLSLTALDYANNRTAPTFQLRHGINNSRCTPPPDCTPTQNEVALFSEPDFGGVCKKFSAGDFTGATALNPVGDNQVASLIVGSEVMVTLYDGTAYSGRSTTFFSSDAGLRDNPISENQVSSLRVMARPATPRTPVLLQPSAEATFTTDDSLTLAWQDSGGGASFQVEITSTEALIQSTSTSLPYWQVNGLAAGTYSWRVRAANPSGAYSNWSSTRAFTITQAQTNNSPYTPTYITGFDGDELDPGWSWTEAWNLTDNALNVRSAPRAFLFSGVGEGLPVAGSLTSPEIQIPTSGYALTFFYRFQGETQSTHWDRRLVQVSSNGGPFETIYQLSSDQPGVWLRSPDLSLDAYAGTGVHIRFYADSLDGLYNESLAWEIDDFRIGEQETVACSPVGEPDNALESARPLTLSSPLQGEICPAGDVDTFRLEIPESGTRLLFDIQAQASGSALDPYLYLFDTDGVSLLASNDDEIPYERPDSRLGYLFNRPGTYYLKIFAWDHPQAGSNAHTYTLTALPGNPNQMDFPISSLTLQVNTQEIRALTYDSGDVALSVSFYLHRGDWVSGSWEFLGTDNDGSDGWRIPFDSDPLPDRRNLAFYALVQDRNLEYSAAAAWNVRLERGRIQYLPNLRR
jgi:murein DD-endopeptidase MepM/ murein hydrolase activator NlpD